MHRHIREKRLATVLVRLHQAQTRSMDSVQVCSGNRISCLIIIVYSGLTRVCVSFWMTSAKSRGQRIRMTRVCQSSPLLSLHKRASSHHWLAPSCSPSSSRSQSPHLHNRWAESAAINPERFYHSALKIVNIETPTNQYVHSRRIHVELQLDTLRDRNRKG